MLRNLLFTPLPKAGLLLAALIALAPPAAAESALQEGEHYERLPIPVDTRDPDKVEVVEVFSYGCIHCKSFQPAVHAWRQDLPDHVDFQRMPAVFNPQWAALAQLYYTVEALGVTDQVHAAIFEAIHDRGVNLIEPELMAELVHREAGIEPDKFHNVYKSFSVRSRVQQADARGRAYRLTGTPTMIVDGTFRVDGRMAGGNAEMLDVVNQLVERRRAAAHEPAAATGR